MRSKKERGGSRFADGEPKIKQKFASRNKIRLRLSDLQRCVASRKKREANAKKLCCIWIGKKLRHTFLQKLKLRSRRELQCLRKRKITIDFKCLASSRIEFG
jgi:hypothetical protein